LADRYSVSWLATARSTTLDMNERFETGRKFDMSAVSSPVLVVWVYGRGQTDTQTRVTTFCVVYDSRKM